ncbi:MAG: hypothetical protein ACOC1P_05925, partial [Minisyncoccales bacterium]
MVYKKYIKRDGKFYGPYYYRSYKKNGRVYTEYIGKDEEKNNSEDSFDKKKDNKNSFRFIIPLVFVLLFILAFFSFNQLSPTGKITAEIDEDYIAGEKLNGTFKLNLNSGEFLPENSEVVVNNSGNTKNYQLKDLIDSGSENTSKGDYYIQGKNISGSGLGYGISGKKTVYPEVDFVMKVYDKEEVSGVDEEETSDDNSEEKTNETENTTEDSNETTEESENESLDDSEEINESEEETNTTEETSDEEKTDKTENTTEDDSETEDDSSEEETENDSKITGAAITGASVTNTSKENQSSENSNSEKESFYVNGTVTAENDFEYELEKGQKAEIVSSEEKVDLDTKDNKAVVSTNYSEEIEGYGDEFVSEEDTKELVVDLSEFDLTAKEGELLIQVNYNNTEIVSAREDISVEEAVNQTENESLNESLNETETNETLSEENQTEINETAENQTISNDTGFDINTSAEIIINQPAKWKKRVNVSDYFKDNSKDSEGGMQLFSDDSGTKDKKNVKVEIPGHAKNISVYKIQRDRKQKFDVDTEEENETESGDEIEDEEEQKELEEEEINDSEKTNETKTEKEPEENQTQNKTLPEEADNTSERGKQTANKTKEKDKGKRTPVTGKISAEVDVAQEKSLIEKFWNKIKGTITGNVVQDENQTLNKTIEITKELVEKENATEFEIEYETPGPNSSEKTLE